MFAAPPAVDAVLEAARWIAAGGGDGVSAERLERALEAARDWAGSLAALEEEVLCASPPKGGPLLAVSVPSSSH